jgi:heme A synthase
VLIGLTTLAILLQAVWAGIFLSYHQRPDSWIEIHARGGEVAILLAALSAVVAFLRMRHRTELWVGSLALTALLILESFIGGRITDAKQDSLTAFHVPLAMLVMALAAWLPLRSRRRG